MISVIPFTENSLTVQCKRYRLPIEGHAPCDRCGKPHETAEEMLWRAAFGIQEFYDLMASLDFLPNSPTLFNAQTGNTLSACFRFEVDDSLLGPGSIMNVAEKAAGVLKFGGGVGYTLSNLRPKGAPIKSTHGQACGPVAVLHLYHAIASIITQGGKRDAAQMGILHCQHPDIREFIHCKDTEDKAKSLSTFNISVASTDAFMEMATTDTQSEEYKLLWEMAQSAWATGDPGVYFIDTAERSNPTPWLGKLTGTNPSMPAGTLVATQDGIFPIEALADSEFMVRSMTGDWAHARCVLSGNDKHLLKLTFGAHRTVSSTPEHRWPVLRGRAITNIPAAEVRPGDWIPMNRNEPLGVDGLQTEEDGFFVGYLFGDGWISQRRSGEGYASGIVFPKEEIPEVEGRLVRYLNQHKTKDSHITAGNHGERYLQFTDQRFLHTLIEMSGWLGKEHLPSSVWTSSDAYVRGFVDGFLCADGYVGSVKDPVVQGTFAHYDAAVEFAKLLSFRGIKASITYQEGLDSRFPNQKHYERNYTRCDIRVAYHQVTKFANVFRITQRGKQNRLETLAAIPRRPAMENNYEQVKAIEHVATADVWDIQVANPEHVFPTQWSYTGNCGEVPLLDNEPCNLGSINLANFVEGPMFNFERLAKVAAAATRFLDTILDRNSFPFQEIDAAARLTRKLGLGVMGFADALAAMRIHYDSEDAVRLGEQIMMAIQKASHAESIRLEGQRGRCPAFEERDDLIRRNATTTCIAPTGTIAILAGVSSGIEPHPFLENTRTMGDGTKLQERISTNGFIPHTATEIDWQWHIKHQAAFQRHTDLAVSKTINMANSCTPADIRDAYIEMWRSGCKGGTVYRTGSRSVEVLKASSANSNTPETQPYTVDTGNRHRMPKTAPAERRSFKVGDTEGYIHLGFLPDGQIGEMFLTGAKAGSTVAGLLDAVAIATSLGAQYGVPWEVWTDKMRNTNFDPSGFTDDQEIPHATSIMDYVAHYIQHYHMTEEERVPAGPVGIACPDCQQDSLVPEEGCLRCYTPGCGYTKC